MAHPTGLPLGQRSAALHSVNVDVLIVASTQSTVDTFSRLEEQQVPYVLIDRQFDGLTANFVGVDDVAVGALATTHLVDVGCRPIAHIGGPLSW